MQLKQVGLVLALFAGFGFAAAGCDVQSNLPTGASSLDSTTAGGLGTPLAPLALEGTDCPNLQEFRLRTTAPGSIEDNVVQAWIKLVGAPADATGLRIWWDYPDGASHDHHLNDLEFTTNEDGTINIELLAGHTYKNLTEETERTIRAELIVGDEGTHCARVRHITVAPPHEEIPCIFTSRFDEGFGLSCVPF
jgi:hypothetical protein